MQKQLQISIASSISIFYKHKKNPIYLDDCGGIRVSLKGGGKQLDDARACS